MIELKGLEDWAREILATSKIELNRRYGSWKKQEELRKSIEELPFFTRYRPVFRTLSDSTLVGLHEKLRGQRCEAKFWIVLLEVLGDPLPNEIAFDLIEREIAISWLGHSMQSEAVFWRLTPLVDETILTLAKRFYGDQNRSLEEFQEVLTRFPNHEWMLDSLSHCSASSLEKRRAYETAIENHPNRDSMLETNPKIEPSQKHLSYFDLSQSSHEDRMRALYGGYNLKQLLEIGRDDTTPDEILHDLENYPGSREVRFNARHNLRRRAEAISTE